MNALVDELNESISNACNKLRVVREEISKNLVGQTYLIDSLLIALITKQHILLEGVPGLAKTSSIKSLADTVDVLFKRIQFTPDLLPADIIGTELYLPGEGRFKVKKGPVFNNLILADEINRAPSKVQSALLEAMQERQVTIGDETYKLPEPFLVLATQNPIDQEGTYQLPEAQIDRFMLKVRVDYPSKLEEKEILDRIMFSASDRCVKVITSDEIATISDLLPQIYMDDKLEEYIVDLIHASRYPKDYGLDVEDYIRFGASPRATIFLALASRAKALMGGRSYVLPEDIRSICFDVLRHRILLSYEAEAEDITAENIISELLHKIMVP